MAQYLLRVAAVNLDNALFDTNDISVQRGASLMALNSVSTLHRDFSALEPITVGASEGLYRFVSDEQEQPVLPDQVSQHLHKHYPWLTFAVDSLPYTDDTFQANSERLLALSRLRQYVRPTLVAPPPEAGSPGPCEFTGTHPLPEGGGEVIKGRRAGRSAAERFEFGRRQRNAFYRSRLPDFEGIEGLQFTDNLQYLTQPDARQDFGNLNGKMAVIYWDGNGFGKIKAKANSPDALKDFDRQIHSRRKGYLASLLDLAHRDSDFRNGSALRLEILLWGGDEIMLAVPAWKGMQVMQHFYEHTAGWEYQGQSLTHAGGIVFCHHKTPIRQVRGLAHDLAEKVKEATREHDAFDYLVLESIDYPVEPLEQFWSGLYGEGVLHKRHPLAPLAAEDLARFDRIREALPRRQLYRIAELWVAHWNDPQRANGEQADGPLHQAIDRLFTLLPTDTRQGTDAGERELLQMVESFRLADRQQAPSDTPKRRPEQYPGWLALVELWDYLAPRNRYANKGGA